MGQSSLMVEKGENNMGQKQSCGRVSTVYESIFISTLCTVWFGSFLKKEVGHFLKTTCTVFLLYSFLNLNAEIYMYVICMFI